MNILRVFEKKLTDIADGDLTSEIDAKLTAKKDEFGDMLKHTNTAIASFRGGIKKLNQQPTQ